MRASLSWLRFAKRKVLPFLACLLLAATGGPVPAADFFWDPDGVDAGNLADGTNLGGAGLWDTSSPGWWNLASNVAWPNSPTAHALFTSTYSPSGPNPFSVTLDSGIIANRLSFLRGGYTLTGGSLELAGSSPTLWADLGESATIETQILGTEGLILAGGGWIRLANNGNSYTGTTLLQSGALVITGEGALGVSTSDILVTRLNSAAASTTTRGFAGGSLVLDGTGGNVLITRNLVMQGQGPWSDRGAALVSTGTNTLSGTVETGGLVNGANVSTRIVAADGTLNLTGTLRALGVAGTTVTSLGGVNQAGASFYSVSGGLAGTGTVESSGGGTLFLNPTDSSGFSGVIRVSGSAASGQSVLRIDSPNVLGTRTSTGTGAVLDMNGGVLAVLMDNPSILAGGSAAHVYGRASSTFFADHTPNSSVRDQTVTFGQLAFEDNITLTFNSRNGYGMTFAAAPVAGSTAGDNDSTFTNNLQGGGLLTFTGNFWSNANNTGNRTVTIGGSGNTLISGNIIASSAAFNHNLTKSGSGTLTISSTGSTLDGNVNINGGTVAITDWRSITNNNSTVSLNSGTLNVIGHNVAQANLISPKVINLSGTTGAATILANQTGTSQGIVLTSDFTATGIGTKTLTLGGSNTAANTISGAIVQNGTTNLTKVDAGRWVLAGSNSYTGPTTIANGILQLAANGAASTILHDSSAITFNAVNVFAGGTLEFIGQASTNNVENLGALTPTNGAGTVKLTPGSGGTASLVFASLGTVGGGGTVNFVAPTANDTISFTTISTTNNIANAGLYYNGSDFAFIPGAGQAVRAPLYGTDPDFATSSTALTAGQSNQITGSFSTGALSIDSLKISGDQTLTLTGNLTIRTAAGSSNSGGIIQTGGSGTITGNFTVGTNGSGATVINVDGAANTLTLESRLGSTGGLTKVGAGTLRLAGANTQTGTISINEGTIRLMPGGTLGGAGALTLRQAGVLELNGITPTNLINAFNNNGVIRNTSATTDVTLTVGGANGTGDSRGIIEDGGAGKIHLVKVGSGAQTWLGLSTYTGTTTIGSTGIVGINNLQNGGMPSGIGASGNGASNLVFNGSSSTQVYGGLSYTGTTNDETDRLFTFNGGVDGGARILSNGANQATSTWTNTGALAFGPNATGNPQGLVLGGASTGDNRFFPVINDNGSAATSLYKTDAGVWHLMGTNGYTGATTLRAGTLYAVDGSTLPTASNLVFEGGNFASSGNLNRTVGTGPGQMQWSAHGAGGFSAAGSALTVSWGAGNVWGTTPGFLGTGALLLNNSALAKSDVTVTSGFEITQGIATTFVATTAAGSATVNLSSGTTAGLAVGQTITGNPNIPAGATIATIVSATQFTLSSGTGVLADAIGTGTSTLAGGYRQVTVGDFTSIGADFATLSGVITGAGSLAKEGTGILNLRGDNTYTGQTLVRAGTLVVETLGHSATPGASSVGDSTLGDTAAGAVLLGNGTTTGGILEYVGLGETSDRYIRLNTTTGGNQIHGDGVGGLILTNVANDLVPGNKILSLRGVSSAANMITSQLANNGGTLGVTIDGSTAWILTGDNSGMSGTVSVTAGALGIGHDNALGTGNFDLSNGTIFAYGGDRNLSGPVRLLNNTVVAFTGDHSLTFSQPLQLLNAANNTGLTSNMAAGTSLTFAGMNANALPTNANRTLTVEGSGLIVVDGNLTTTQTAAGGLALLKTGNGVLVLGGDGGGANNFNRNNATVDIDRGTLRLGAGEVIGHGLDTQGTPVAYGGLTLTPELANGDTAIFDLNGFSETINGLTMNSDGTAIIDNTSASAASLTFGANNSTVSIGGGIGTYTIRNSGGGALSLTKTGNTAMTIPTGVTLTYTGATNVTGGSLTIASAVNGTSALSVSNSGGLLALTGGITSPSAITSVVATNQTTLSLLDGNGNKLTSLTNLQLGSPGGSMTFLSLNVGDQTTAGDELNTDTLAVLSGGVLSLHAGNQVTFDLTDIGLSANETYDLVSVADGGLTSGALSSVDWLLGATPGGFDSISLVVTDHVIRLQTGNLITGAWYWNAAGTLDNWTDAANWSELRSGASPRVSAPGAGSDVIFVAETIAGGTVTTTLEQNIRINSLAFEAGPTPPQTPTAVVINPGAVATNRLDIAPQDSSDGIHITAQGPGSVSITAPVRLGADQTWGVAPAASVLSLGPLLGEADVTKSGDGRVVLTSAADATFNSGQTADVTVSAGTLELQNAAALGSTINNNLARVTVGSGGAFYYNGAAGTVANPLTLDGGTLSAGTATQIYSGTLKVNSASFINLADNNGINTAAARNITLSGVLSGSGSLTIDGNNTASGGNQIGGTLTINNAANTWSGGVNFNRGTLTLTSAASPNFTSNSLAFNGFGRVILQGVDGQTLNRTGSLTLALGAIAEYQVDNTTGTQTTDYVVNQNGTVSLGGGGVGGVLRVALVDTFAKMNIAGGVTLGGNSSISVSNAATRLLTISGVISDGGLGYSLAINDDAGGWAQTNGIVRLTGLNTFSGNVTVDSGSLEFDTVSNIGGAASALGQGSAITTINTATLRYIGSTAQSTNRPINSTTGALTLAANGTGSIDYTGSITIAPSGDGSFLVLTGAAGNQGYLSGGITQTGDTADATVNGGTWTHRTGTSRIGDDVTVTGADTIFNLDSGLLQVRDDFTVTTGATLNLNGTGVLSFNTPTLTSGTLRAVGGGVINLNANNGVVATEFDELRIGTDAAGVGTFDLNTFNQTVTAFVLGNRNLDRSGVIDGSGTLTVTGNFDIYGGTVNANLASTGTEAMEKIGPGTVILTGNNSGLASTGDTIVYDGVLVLNYTASNTSKINASEPLDLRGARVNLIGNNGAGTVQNVNGLTLASGGSSILQVTAGTGQQAVLNLGAITRGNLAQDGTVRFLLPTGTQSATHGFTTTSPNTVYGLLGTGAAAATSAAYATVDDGTGTWFATASAGNVVALVSASKDDVLTWLSGDHVTDATGFTGTVTRAYLHSLRFNAAGGSDLAIAEAGSLIIGSGGLLVTDAVGGTPSITGGTLAAPTTELVVVQDSSQAFEIGSDIRVNHGVTKAGAGVLRLTGDNVYTGATEVQNGILQVGGNGIGDNSVVTLSASRDSTLQLLGDETIGRLQGGSRNPDSDYGTVAIDSHTLTINQSGSTTYAGFFTGSGGIVKNGPGNLQLTNASAGFTGVVTVESGTLYFTTAGQIDAGIIRVNRGGALLFDQNGTTAPAVSHVPDAGTLTLNSADGGFLGQAIIRGLGIRTDQDATRDENIGTLNLNSGASYVGMEATTASDDADILVADLVRLNRATLNVRGTNLGGTLAQENELRFWDPTNEANFLAASGNLVGGGGAADSQNISIVPWAIGESTTGALAAGNMGNSLVTYVSGSGFRPLTFSEYKTHSTALATDNVRESLGSDPLSLPGMAINSLVLNNQAAPLVKVMGTGAGQSLAVNSGALLFTITGAAGNNAYETRLEGFDAGITVGATNEYVIHVVNPNTGNSLVTGSGNGTTFGSSRVTTASTTGLQPGMAIYGVGIPVGATIVSITGATSFEISMPANLSATNQTYQYSTLESLTATIQSPLTSAADITKSGRGILVLSGSNTAGGGTRRTTLNEGILEISGLGNIGGTSGDLVFAGGTLRLGAGFADDLSQRSILFLDGGGTLDTNGIDLTLANSLGSGVGGFTKVGSGNLTLNAAATYTGATSLIGGTLTIGADNATGLGGGLNLAGGTTLALGAHTLTAGLVSVYGISPAITGTGTLDASQGFVFGNTGDLEVDAVLAGEGGLFKAQTNSLTLRGANTYTGTTEVQNGVLSFNSVANVGGGPSALGAPTTAEAGIIRMGLGTAATTLQYTGTGHATDRVIAMQGTTGNLTLDADGTGALVLTGGVRFEMSGNKTLFLRGSSADTHDNTVGGIVETGGILTLNKTDANTWRILGGNSYSGATQIDNGTLKVGAEDALPLTTAVRLGVTTTAGTLDLNGFNQTIGSLSVNSTSGAVTNRIVVDAGNTLTINGAVTLGVNADNATTRVEALGGGSIVVNSGGASLAVGGASGSTNDNAVFVDFSGLDSLTANLGSGSFRLGDLNSGTENNASSFRLATNNSITAASLRVGDGAGGAFTHTLTLGSGTNTFHTDLFNIGSAGNTIRSGGSVVFDGLDTTGTLTLRASDGSGRAVLNLVNTSGSTAGNIDGTLNLDGHTADLLVSNLTMATRSVGTGAATATLNFNQGILDITTLNMATRTGAGTGTAAATVNLGDSAAPGTPSTSIGTLNMAVNTSAGGTSTANFNVSGGDVAIGTGSGTAINMANAAAGRAATSTLHLTGGNVSVTGNIIRTGGSGTENATVTLDGATLDLNGNSIGTGAAGITLNALSGTLRNLNELNGGGNLVKTGPGLLVLEGDNSYTGRTVVNAGILSISSEENLGANPAVAGAAHLEINGGTLRTTATLAIDDSNRGLTIGASGGTLETASGTALTVASAHPITFNGALSKTGDGALYVNGNSSGPGTVTVAAGLLGGSGTVSGNTTIESGAVLTGGTDGTVGSLSFSGDLTSESGSTWLIDLVRDVDGSSDRITVGDALDLGSATLSLSFTGDYTDLHTYTIATYSSLTGTFNGLADGDTISGYQIHYGSVTPGAITLTAVPEPGTLGLLGLAFGGVLVRRWRKRRASAAAADEEK